MSKQIGSINTNTPSFRQYLSEIPFEEAEQIIASLPDDEQNKVLQEVLLRKFVATFKKHHINRVFNNIKALIKECDERDEAEANEEAYLDYMAKEHGVFDKQDALNFRDEVANRCANCHEGERWRGEDCCKECIERCCDGSGCDGCGK